jgi:hypothetical protein
MAEAAIKLDAHRKPRKVTKRLADLKVSFFVREALEEDRVEFFMELYRTDAKVPPVDIERGTNDIVDGRHRYEAQKRLKRRDVECIEHTFGNQLEKLAFAMKANLGGALPPTRHDVVFTFKQMIEAGATQKSMEKIFVDYYKPSHIRDYMRDAHRQVEDAKIARAKSAVNRDMPVSEAAKKFGVDKAKLQAEISGDKKGKSPFPGFAQFKSQLSQQSKSNTRKVGNILSKLFKRVIDGEIEPAKVRELLDHEHSLQGRKASALASWDARFVKQGVPAAAAKKGRKTRKNKKKVVKTSRKTKH